MTLESNKLHVGCGPQLLDGWINVDNQPYPGVDHVLDVREAFPFTDLRFIYAEHFIEHLPYDDAMTFLRNCRQALRDDGVMRISTPNLDWVWITQYHYGNWKSEAEAVKDCFWINRGFHGWGHRFLYNKAALKETLHDAGFAEVVSCDYGESSHPELNGIERHEQYYDVPEMPHIIIVEASGRRAEPSELLPPARDEFLTAVASK
jgi:predicted SAM-dependent methyltransferase